MFLDTFRFILYNGQNRVRSHIEKCVKIYYFYYVYCMSFFCYFAVNTTGSRRKKHLLELIVLNERQANPDFHPCLHIIAGGTKSDRRRLENSVDSSRESGRNLNLAN